MTTGSARVQVQLIGQVRHPSVGSAWRDLGKAFESPLTGLTLTAPPGTKPPIRVGLPEVPTGAPSASEGAVTLHFNCPVRRQANHAGQIRHRRCTSLVKRLRITVGVAESEPSPLSPLHASAEGGIGVSEPLVISGVEVCLLPLQLTLEAVALVYVCSGASDASTKRRRDVAPDIVVGRRYRGSSADGECDEYREPSPVKGRTRSPARRHQRRRPRR